MKIDKKLSIHAAIFILAIILLMSTACEISPRELMSDYADKGIVSSDDVCVHCDEYEQSNYVVGSEHTLENDEYSKIETVVKEFLKYSYRVGYAISTEADIDTALKNVQIALAENVDVREHLALLINQVVKNRADINVQSFYMSDTVATLKSLNDNTDIMRVDAVIDWNINSQYNIKFPREYRSALYGGDNIYGLTFYIAPLGDTYEILAWSEYSFEFQQLTLFSENGVEVVQEAIEPDDSNMLPF